jgi:hypothetical protein
MSIAYSGVEPQPSLAWQFQSSNVDSVTSLAPSSQVSPGPAQLQGSAALVTNAPTSNTAVYFPGSVGSYMNLGASSATNINQNTSNIFIEAWVYFIDFTVAHRIFVRAPDAVSPAGTVDIVFRTSSTTLYFNYGTGGVAGGANGPSALTAGRWYHVAISSVVGGGNSYCFMDGVPGTGIVVAQDTYNASYTSIIGAGSSEYSKMYIRDLRVVRGGVVPTATFTPEAATWAYGSVPSYVTGGTNVLGLAAQYMTPTTLIGTPLFNQLSQAATSSAVGAFSLRAVNGTSVKAVQVRNGTTSATQDFYADRLGNLLTAPVTGQSLANWLGGATGYVTTWYDQSGRGNHATQATVANQPTVTVAPSGNGYVPVFTSPSPNKYLSIPSSINLGAINGSYTKSLWTYVTSNVNQYQNFLATSTAATGQGIHYIGWNFGTGSGIPYFSAGQNNYPVNLVSTTFPSNTWTHLAVTYNNPTQTFIMYRNGTQVYSNTAYTSSFNAGDGLLPTNFRIGVGYGNACNSQNYDVNIFNTALSATDITTLYNSRIY